MSVQYQAITWSRQKKVYDVLLASGAAGFLGLFVAAGAVTHPEATAETLLIRALGTCAFVMLHLILCIGPLCRLDKRFLPLLYNRRHMGVTMFLTAAAHGVFSIIQFHSSGDENPLVSLLSSNTRVNSLSAFPFQQLGLLALLILFLMAATSHDFWLHTLTPPVWKRLHMLVYAAYGLLVAHVAFGALQSAASVWPAVLTGAGLTIVAGLHLAAGIHERRRDSPLPARTHDGFVAACEFDAIPEGRATVAMIGAERVAIFKHEGKPYAISNVCAHQNGPLGEGRTIDGCVTCPWHGYQFRPDTGMSPPPFQDRVPAYRCRVDSGKVWVHPQPVRHDG
ncbi:MAG: Rieske (2Fe-2S) protein [Acidobacteria bacterium]|nr:Rieske (2Fe-2S) protein [Acidobacteriota bacterium]